MSATNFFICVTATAERIPAKGNVTYKYYDAPYEVDTYIMVGDVQIPTTTEYPESFRIEIQCNGKIYTREISERKYDSIERNHKVDFYILKGYFMEY